MWHFLYSILRRPFVTAAQQQQVQHGSVLLDSKNRKDLQRAKSWIMRRPSSPPSPPLHHRDVPKLLNHVSIHSVGLGRAENWTQRSTSCQSRSSGDPTSTSSRLSALLLHCLGCSCLTMVSCDSGQDSTIGLGVFTNWRSTAVLSARWVGSKADSTGNGTLRIPMVID